MHAEFCRELFFQIESHLAEKTIHAIKEWEDPWAPLNEVMVQAAAKAAKEVLEKHERAWAHKAASLYRDDD